MIIGIDGYCLTHTQRKGLGNYVFHLIQNLQSVIQPEDKIVLFSPVPVKASFARVINISGNGLTSQYVWEQWLLPKMLRHHRVGVLHCPTNTRPFQANVPIIVSVHDLIMFLPSKRSPYEQYVKLFTRHAIMKSSGLITVSNASEEDIRNTFNTRVPIHSIHPGVPTTISKVPSERPLLVHQRHKVVHFATPEPRKNTRLVLKAAVEMPEVNIVLLGMTRDQVEQKWGTTIPNNIICRGYVTDEEKIRELSTSVALLYVTTHEGFGFPVLEAMAHSCPVIVSKDKAVIETGGDAAITIDGSVDSLIKAIRECATNLTFREEKIRLGHRNLSRFNWLRTAQRTYEVYQETQRSI